MENNFDNTPDNNDMPKDTYSDPNAGQQYTDPNAGQTNTEAGAGQSYTDPNAGQSYTDPNAGQSYTDPNAGQSYTDANAGQQYYGNANQNQQYNYQQYQNGTDSRAAITIRIITIIMWEIIPDITEPMTLAWIPAQCLWETGYLPYLPCAYHAQASCYILYGRSGRTAM